MAVDSTDRLALVNTADAADTDPAPERFVRRLDVDAPTDRYEPGGRPAKAVATRLDAYIKVGTRHERVVIDRLSTRGARFTGTLTLSPGQQVELGLTLDAATIAVRSEVVRVHALDLLTDEIAVHFVEAPERAVSRIEAFVAAQLA